ncbi:glutathione S-transferase family protein [Coralliovum pocilloporae]|uniref:glutathione S-transferase family protein n=1 Tax=Coralliovum pocilloporae TaxID=3066369 RepID=UPI003307BC2E
MKLIIGNRNYSSWSFRAWLGLTMGGVAFETELRPFDEENDFRDYLAFSPTGKVPVLQDQGRTVWESLAILEYAAETHPEKPFWPEDADARTYARCIAHEMHAGFSGIRNECPMNMRRAPGDLVVSEAVRKDVARIETILDNCLQTYGGPFLFGPFSIADAMYAPVVNRLEIYRLSTHPAVERYTQAMKALPAWQDWVEKGCAEPWVVAMDEV